MVVDRPSTELDVVQVMLALRSLRKFSSNQEIAIEASLSVETARVAIDWLACNGFLERSPPAAGKRWKLSASGSDMLLGINVTGQNR
jgi:hypothetical protein